MSQLCFSRNLVKPLKWAAPYLVNKYELFSYLWVFIYKATLVDFFFSNQEHGLLQ